MRFFKQYGFYLFVLVMLIPAMALRDYTPDNELRYLNIADEALQGGHFFAFTNQGLPYADKPPLYLWFVMLGKWLWGSHQLWFLSLFSVLPALGVVAVMDSWTRRAFADGQSRRAARWLLLTSAYFIGSALVLRMDMLMCLFIVLALRVFYNWYSLGSRAPRRYAWLFPLYVFLALFTKGPVGVLVPLLGTLAFLGVSGRWREAGRYWGWRTWGVLLVLCAAWFGLVYADGGSAYLNNLLFHQTVDRAVKSFNHTRPFWYYGLSAWYVGAPWSLLVAGAWLAARRQWLRCAPLERLFLTVSVVTFVMLSCFSSKVDIYLLPALPFTVYLGAIWLSRQRGHAVWARWLVAVVPGLVYVAALPAVGVAAGQAGAAPFCTALVWTASAVLTLAGLYGWWLLWRGSGVCAAVRTYAAALLCALFVAAWDLPRFNAYIGYGAVCREARAVAAPQPGAADVAYATWHVRRSENMSVYLGRPVRVLSDEAVRGPLPAGMVVIVRSKDVARHDWLRSHPQLRFVRQAGPYAVARVQDSSAPAPSQP